MSATDDARALAGWLKANSGQRGTPKWQAAANALRKADEAARTEQIAGDMVPGARAILNPKDTTPTPRDQSSVSRQLELGTRATGMGLAAIPGILYDAMGGVTNIGIAGLNELGADLPYVRPFRENANAVMDAAGVAKPETPAERIMGGVVEGAASVIPSVGLGSAMAAGTIGRAGTVANTGLRTAGETLAAGPNWQAFTGGFSGLGQATAAEIAPDSPLTQIGGALVGALIPTAAGAAARGVVRGGGTGRARMAESVKNFESFGGSPTVGQASGKGWLGAIEAILARTPGAQTQMRNAVQRSADAAAKRIGEIVGNTTPADAGRKISIGLDAAGERYNARASALYDEAYDQVETAGRRSPRAADLENTKGLLAGAYAELADAPASAAETLRPTVKRIEAILSDLEGARSRGLDESRYGFANLRKARTALGEDLKTAGLMGVSGSQESKLSSLYAALSEDLKRYATKQGAGKAITLADRYYRAARYRTDDVLGSLGKKDDYNEVYDALSRADDLTLKSARSAMGEDAWSAFAKQSIKDLGTARAGVQNAAGDAFSLETFLTNYSKIPPDTRRLMFGRIKGGGNMDEAIDRIAKAAEDVRAASRILANPSGTAGVTANLNASALFLGSLLYEPWAAGAVAASAGAANGLARLMASPRFVRFLAASTRIPIERAPALIGRLSDIAESEPELKEDIAAFLAQIKK